MSKKNNVVSMEPSVNMTRDKFIDVAFNGRKGDILVMENVTAVTLYENDIPVVVESIIGHSGEYEVSMLPDVYTFSDFGDHIIKTEFDLHEELSVICTLDYDRIEGVFAATAEAVHDLNLYGYVTDDDEEEEEE